MGLFVCLFVWTFAQRNTGGFHRNTCQTQHCVNNKTNDKVLFKKLSDATCAATARIFLLWWSCNYTRACREPQAAPVLMHRFCQQEPFHRPGPFSTSGPSQVAACCTVGPGLVLMHSSMRPPAFSCCINMNEGAA